MPKIRILILLLTLLVVGAAGTFSIYIARGYKFDFETFSFIPRGILVVNSDPNGAQIIIDGELETATNATISLPPDTYDVEIKKEGYYSWYKRITIKKEEVTQINASLFPAAPSLSAVTFSGVTAPSASSDYSKFAYIITPESANGQEPGLWVIESVNLPIGFNKEPKHITDGDLTGATMLWSPDSREILLTTDNSVFLLTASDFTQQAERVNVASQKQEILDEWDSEREKRLTNRLDKLPDEMRDILSRKAEEIEFSPDENKVLYKASTEAQIPDDLIEQLPGASTQKQQRDIKVGNKYIYDIKEDRNFLVADDPETILRWMPNSNQVMQPKPNEVIIFDYDGTNKQTVYSGSYVHPFAFPYGTTSQMLMATNLGATDKLPNLYLLNLK